MSGLTPDLACTLERLGKARLVVLGDFLIDEFIFGEISRVSREAPVLILRYGGTRICPGGAANTVANAAALGAQVAAIGVVGDDPDADQLCELWPASVSREGVIKCPEAQTTRKSRILAGSFHSFRQQVVRIDRETPVPYARRWEKKMLESLEAALPAAGAMIISDYSLGNVTPRIKRTATDRCRELNIPLVIDSRDHPSKFPGATTVTPNITEVEAGLGKVIGQEIDRLEHFGRLARSRWQVDSLLVTRGRLGMSLFTEQANLHMPAFGSSEAVDVTGAGDTVAATFATALASGSDFETAACLANIAGGLVVMKKGTATVTGEEIRLALQELTHSEDPTRL